MTDYLKLVQSDNPYDSLVAGDAAQAARQAVAGVASQPPDAEAKLLQLATKAGVPVESVRAQQPEIQRRVAIGEIDYDKLVRDNPVTAGALTQNAAVARDDVGTMQQIENTFVSFFAGIGRGGVQDELGPLHYRAMTGELTPAEQQQRAELKRRMQAIQSVGDEATTNPVAWFLGATGYTGRQLVTSLREGGKGAAGGAAVGATAAAVIGQLGPQVGLPEEIVTVPGAAAFGARAGYISASTVHNYKMEAGFAFDEFEGMRNTDGTMMPRDVAQGAAAAVGLLNAGLETVGDLALARMVPGFDKLIAQGPKAAIRQILKRPTARAAIAAAGKKWLRAASIEGVTEGVQELVTILGREVAGGIADGTFESPPIERDVARIGQAAAEAFAGGGGVSAPGAVVQARSGIREVQRAQTSQDFMTALGESSQASKLRERAPEAFRDFIAKAKEQGPIENVYVPAEAFTKYFQSMGVNPAQIAEQVGARNYSEAAAAGTDVVIPLEDYATWLAPTEHHAKLLPDVKLHMGDLSMREAEAFEAEREDAQKKLAEDAKVANDQSAAPLEQIKQDILSQLTQRYELSTADSYATLYAKTIGTLAERAGVDPLELHKSYGLTVESPIGALQADGTVLQQGDLPDDADGMSAEEILQLFGADAAETQINASGESAASLEAQSRLESEKRQGRQRVKITRTGQVVPLNTVDAVDTMPQAGEVVLQRGVGASEWTVLDRGAEVDEAAQARAIDAAGAWWRSEIRLFQSSGDVTQTESFKRWFGDSKVVDENGEPLVVYHGTPETGLSEFKKTPGTNSTLFGNEPVERNAFFFTTRQDFAQNFAQKHGDTGRVLALHLRAENPVDLRDGFPDPAVDALVERGFSARYFHTRDLDNIWEVFDGQEGAEIVAALKDAGYDGAIFQEPADPDKPMRGNNRVTTYAVFDPEQIKSATGNDGTFDADDPSILSQDESKDGKRGFIRFGADRKFTIGLLEKADLSTFLHETGHFWLEVMGDLAARPGSSEQIKADYQALLGWFGVESREQITVEHHEQFARANEAYLMEGNAPSAELRSVFQRFRAWLGLIYRHVASLNVKLNDDVRAVFDRIYATDNEIEAARRQLDAQPLFATAADMGVTEQEFAAYAKQGERQIADAKDKLQAELMREYQRTREAWWKDKRAEVREAVAAEIDALPQYKAFAALTTGDVKLNKDDLVRRYGAEYLKRLPRSKGWVYSKTGGADADTAAEMLGYKSGDALVQALVNLRPRNEVIDAETDKRMAAEYGDMRLDGTIADDAMAALHNEQRAAVIAAELRALQRLQAQAKPVLAARERGEREQRATALAIPPADVFRDAARGMVGQMQVRDLQPQQYLLAERRASRAAFEAAAKKDYMTAAVEKQRELMNHHLYLAATKAKQEMDAVYEYAGKLDKPAARQRIGKAGADYQEQIDAILERYEFRRVTQREIGRRQSLRDFAAAMEEQGLLVNVPDEMLEEARRVNYREATVDELRAVRDTLKNIEHLAGLKNKLLRKREAVEFEAVKGDLIGSILENFDSTGELRRPNLVGETVREKGARLWKKFDAAHLKVEQLVQWMDGGRVDGPWAKFFFDLADDAQAREYDLHREVTAKIQALSESMGRKWRNSLTDKTAVVMPGLNAPITRYTLLSIALNAGNASNLDRLKLGYAWSDEVIASALDQLTEQDWKFVQGTWDVVESLWPEIAALEKRVTGVAPPKVEAKPITTRFGEFKGGYFPLAYDPKNSTVGEKQAEQAESVAQFMANGYGRAHTSKGHTKQRVEQLRAPVLLDFEQVLTSHLAKVIKDISHREAVYSINKILHDNDIKRALIDTVGEAQYRELNKWAQVLIADRADTLHQATGGAALVMKFRTNMAIVTMGWKISTMMAQFAGFGPSADLVKPRYLTQALVDFNRYGPWSTHRETLLRFVHERSGEMRNRTDTLERDVKDALRRLQGDTSPLAAVRRSAFYLTAMADRQVTVPTWLGAYRQGLAEGLGEEDAIRAGDRAVRLSQGAGGAKDLAGVQRNNELMRLLTMYYSPFSVLYARLRDLGHTTRRVQDLPRAVARLLALVILPAVLGDLLAGRGPEDDEDETWWAIRKALLYPIASVPLVRDLSGYLEGAVISATGEGEMRFKPEFTLSPVVGAMDKLARTVFLKIPDAFTGARPWDDVAWDSLEAAGYVFGLPTAQLRISGEYVTDVLTDDANPESPQEALHDLLFRRSKPQ